jgi:transcriptional regulator
MHVPPLFRAPEDDALAVIEAHPFATLIATSTGDVAHVPLLLDRSRRTLLGHVARASAIAGTIAGGARVLAIFLGPHGYVSPRWYRSAPQVPTWNYVAAHVTGVARLEPDDASARAILGRTVARFEPPGGFAIDQLPDRFVRELLPAISAFEITIESIVGNAKLGQNRARADREGAIEGLEREGGPTGVELAASMRAVLTR